MLTVNLVELLKTIFFITCQVPCLRVNMPISTTMIENHLCRTHPQASSLFTKYFLGTCSLCRAHHVKKFMLTPLKLPLYWTQKLVFIGKLWGSHQANCSCAHRAYSALTTPTIQLFIFNKQHLHGVHVSLVAFTHLAHQPFD